jgi:hypothetical protein
LIKFNNKTVKATNEQKQKTLWQKAAKDPLFLKDIADIENDFKYADAETAKNIN